MVREILEEQLALQQKRKYVSVVASFAQFVRNLFCRNPSVLSAENIPCHSCMETQTMASSHLVKYLNKRINDVIETYTALVTHRGEDCAART